MSLDQEDDFLNISATKIRSWLGADDDVDVQYDENALLSDDDNDSFSDQDESNANAEDSFVAGLSENLNIPVDQDGNSDLDPDLFSDSDYTDSQKSKSDKEEDLFSTSFRNDLRGAAGMKAKKAKAKKGRPPKAKESSDPFVRQQLSEANEHFVSGNIAEAKALYKSVIEKDPRNYAALKTLGSIAKDEGKLSNCCVYWILAAEVNPREAELWATAAEISVSLGHLRQAFYCYSKAVAYDTKDHKYLWERTKLYEENGKLAKALLGYQRLLSHNPTSQQIVIEIAKLYSELHRVTDAIEMFMEILNKNIEYYSMTDAEKEAFPKNFPDFEWSELNILAELYYKNGQFSLGLTTMKKTARWLHDRSDETFWDEVEDDSEFDERRFTNPDIQKLPIVMQQREYFLPIDIRVKMGLFRLRCDDVPGALVQFKVLLEEADTQEFEDLFIQVANSLEAAGQFEEALKYYVPLFENTESVTTEILSSMGKCYQEVGDYEQAVSVYNYVLDAQSDDVNALMALAETYFHLGDLEKSRMYSSKVREISKSKSKEPSKSIAPDSEAQNQQNIFMSDSEDDSNPALLADIKTKGKRKNKKQRMSAREKKDLENKLIADTLSKYKRLTKLESAVSKRDIAAIEVWLQVASDLIELICGVKSFFIRDRSRTQNEVLYVNQKNLKLDISRRLERLTELHELANSNYFDIDPSLTYVEGKSYRGLSFEQWFDIFMRYSLLGAMFGDPVESVQVTEIARSMIEFHKDERKQSLIGLVKLSIFIITENHDQLMLTLRELLNSHRFSRDVFKIFVLSLPSGRKNHELFMSLNHQKYFLRQLKAWDTLRFDKTISGSHRLNKKDVEFDHSSLNPYLLSLYSMIMLSGKSYSASLYFLLKAYEEFKYDPMICLLLGLSCVHRGMQRSSGNRHMYILQAMSYFDEYKNLRTIKGREEAQEVDYNFGRLFHQLNLTYIAVEYYQKVLYDYKDINNKFDLKKEAAYNLSGIYQVSGNSTAAKALIDKFLTV